MAAVLTNLRPIYLTPTLTIVIFFVCFKVHTHVPTTRTEYKELIDGIEKFFVTDVMRLVSNKLPGFRESELRYLTFLYTCPLTTLFGMQMAGMPDRSHIKDAQAITIHLVGVRVAEFR